MSDDFNVEDYIESTLSRTSNNTNNVSTNIDAFIKDIELQSKQNGHKDGNKGNENNNEKISDSTNANNKGRRNGRSENEVRGGRDSRERSIKKDNNDGRDRKRRDSRDRRRSRSRDKRRSRSRDKRRDSRDRNRSNSRDGDKIKSEKEEEVDPLTKDQRTVFVSQLTAKVNEIDVKAFFQQVGTVKKVTMVRDKNSGKHKGFAYIEMSKLEVIPNCLLFNNIIPNFQKFPILVQGSQAEKNAVARIQKESSDGVLGSKGKILSDLNGPDTRIYIGNIHTSINEAALASVLEPFGELIDIRLHRDETGTSKGFAFAKFVKSESAKLCISGLNGVELVGRPLKVNVVTSPDSIATNTINTANNMISNTNPSWKIDDEAGAQGFTTLQRQQLMQSLGQRSGITVPMLVMPSSTASYNVLQGTPSCYLVLSNMFDLAQETEHEWNLSLEEEVVEECNKYGSVESCKVETIKSGGYIYLKLNNIQSATNVATSLNGRYFSGRTIAVLFIDEITHNNLVQ